MKCKNHIRRFLPHFFIITFFLIFCIPAWTAQPNTDLDAEGTILILNSYHPGYPWSDEEQDGIIQVFREIDKNFEPPIEYLDAKRLPGGQHLQNLKKLFLSKYKNHKFTMIIALDNPALYFAIDNQREIFGDAPIVFCGINNFSPAMLKGHTNVTGIAESLDMAGTIEVMLKLHPKTREILVLQDYAVTGPPLRKEIEAFMPRFPVKIRFIENLAMDDILKQLGGLPDDTLVFLTGFVTDKTGRVFGQTELTKLFSKHSPVPVYTTHESRLGCGTVGGKMLSAKTHGENAAKMAMRIFSGEKVSAIPVVTKSDARYMFDYTAMERFKIPLSALPEGSIIINKPVPFYTTHRNIILVALTIIGFLCLIIGIMVIDMRKRRHLVKKLRHSESRQRAFLDNIPDPAWLKDTEGRYLAVNQAWCRFFGRKADEVIGMQSSEIMFTSSSEDSTKRDLELLKEKIPLRYESVVENTEGIPRWLDVVRSPLCDDHGLVVGIVMVARDITDRKLAEQVLRENEEKYRSIFENSVVGIFQSSNNGRFIAVNSALAKIHGFASPEEMMAEITDIGSQLYVSREDRKRYVDILSAEGMVKNFEVRQYRKDKSMVWLSLNANAIMDAQGNLLYYQGIVEDITYKKLAEETIRESEERYRMLFENSADGIVLATSEGDILAANVAACNMFGRTEEELCQIGRSGIVDPSDHRVGVAWEERDRKGTFKSEYFHIRKDGTRFLCEVTSTIFKDEHGQGRACTILRDITEKRKAEEEREKLKEQLLQAQKMESIGQLAGGIAHDLNNLLSPILGYTELLLMEFSPNDAHHENVEQIHHAGEKAKNLVKQLLAFGRKQLLDLKPVDLRQVITGIEKLLRRTLREDIKLDLHMPDEPGFIRADVGQIEQVLMNLAVNGQDAMPDGGTLMVELTYISVDKIYAVHYAGLQPGHYVLLTMSDNGSGMDRQTLDRIFDPFFTTKEKGKGTGLGLSTVYGIVKQHGGYIWVDSEIGAGSTFKIFLPQVADISEKIEFLVTDSPFLPQGKETVLIVEDDKAVRDMTSRMLERQGYRVIVSENGEHCLKTISTNKETIHLLLTDVVMPGMNGKELYKCFNIIQPGVKVLFMSGYNDDVIGHHGMLDEETPFIQKPFSLEALAQKVRKVLDS